jgi:hypothetical protein
MPANLPRSFIHHPYGPPLPVDRLKFAVVNDDNRIISAVWSVFPHSNPRKPDFFVTATGFQGNAKFSFHKDVLNQSWLSEAHERLVSDGVVPPGSRHQQQLPIPGLPWHGLTVRFVQNLLSKRGHSADDFDGTIFALPAPRPGQVLQVGFFLATGSWLEVKGAQFSIGEVGGGGRSLAVLGSYVEQDNDAAKERLKDLLARQPVPDHVLAKVSPDDDLAMHLCGIENGAMVVTEAHNVRFVPPVEPASE